MPALLAHTYANIRSYGSERFTIGRRSKRFTTRTRLRRVPDGISVSHTCLAQGDQGEGLRVARTPFGDRRRRYDWAARSERTTTKGTRIVSARRAFGFCRCLVAKAVERGELQARPPATPIELVLYLAASNDVKRRLLEAGILKIVATGAESPSGGANASPSKSTTSTASGTTIDSRIFGCSAQTVTVKRRPSQQEINEVTSRNPG